MLQTMPPKKQKGSKMAAIPEPSSEIDPSAPADTTINTQTGSSTLQWVSYNPEHAKGKTRRRTSPEQVAGLEKAFQRNPKPMSEVRNSLAEQLQMQPREVQIWFQNRRAKERQKYKAAFGLTSSPAGPVGFIVPFASSPVAGSANPPILSSAMSFASSPLTPKPGRIQSVLPTAPVSPATVPARQFTFDLTVPVPSPPNERRPRSQTPSPRNTRQQARLAAAVAAAPVSTITPLIVAEADATPQEPAVTSAYETAPPPPPSIEPITESPIHLQPDEMELDQDSKPLLPLSIYTIRPKTPSPSRLPITTTKNRHPNTPPRSQIPQTLQHVPTRKSASSRRSSISRFHQPDYLSTSHLHPSTTHQDQDGNNILSDPSTPSPNRTTLHTTLIPPASGKDRVPRTVLRHAARRPASLTALLMKHADEGGVGSSKKRSKGSSLMMVDSADSKPLMDVVDLTTDEKEGKGKRKRGRPPKEGGIPRRRGRSSIESDGSAGSATIITTRKVGRKSDDK
ncbi:hypothetical protein HK097_009832, partial [Rhizophlyctis rosea]